MEGTIFRVQEQYGNLLFKPSARAREKTSGIMYRTRSGGFLENQGFGFKNKHKNVKGKAMDIDFFSSLQESEAMKQKLSNLQDVQGLDIELYPTDKVYRGVVTPILVATISASTALVAVIVKEWISWIKQSKSNQIKLTGASGCSIEVPANTPDDKIQNYIDLVKELDRKN